MVVETLLAILTRWWASLVARQVKTSKPTILPKMLNDDRTCEPHHSVLVEKNGCRIPPDSLRPNSLPMRINLATDEHLVLSYSDHTGARPTLRCTATATKTDAVFRMHVAALFFNSGWATAGDPARPRGVGAEGWTAGDEVTLATLFGLFDPPIPHTALLG